MAKRRTRVQIDADKIIKAELMVFGEKVHEQATRTSRRDTGRLQDEQNFRFPKDTQIEFAQMFYGAYNFPKGVGTKRSYENGKLKVVDGMNALLIAINQHRDESMNIISTTIVDRLTEPFK